MKKHNQFKKEYPNVFNLRPNYTRSTLNDYHSKNTAGGFGRNKYGKPYYF